jgi:F-type H+-transporting ATPase subunit a
MLFAVQEHVQEHAAEAAHGAGEKFNAGKTIIEHVTNSAHPLIHVPSVMGIDLSVTKHVLMLWIVAATLLVVLTVAIRRYLKQVHNGGVPSGFAGAIEWVVELIRDQIVQPNVGRKWVPTWAPLIFTFFFFILGANAIGLIPIFEVLALADRFVLHTSEGSIIKQVIHGGTTATANFNVTAALATITFFAIIIAGAKAHGFVTHWKNMVPHGLPGFVYVILIPIEIMGMFVRPFALTMRLAANMTGGHIAILSILSFVFLAAQILGRAIWGIGIGVVISLPMAAGISILEVIVVLVQAYVFTLLTAVFVGMAIHVHH